jgi:hypothetical protein
MKRVTGLVVGAQILTLVLVTVILGLASYSVYRANHPLAPAGAPAAEPVPVPAPMAPAIVADIPAPIIIREPCIPPTTVSGGPHKTEKRVALLVVGGGMGGHAAMYEAARGGVGRIAHADGMSHNTGIMLIEKGSMPCGIIEPVTFVNDSKWDKTGSPHYATPDEQAYKNPYSPNYKPYRMTPHANYINLLTQPGMRCLGNELGIAMQSGTDYSYEVYLNGKMARNKYFNYDGKGCSHLSGNYTGGYGFANGGGTLAGAKFVEQVGGNGFNIFTIPAGDSFNIVDAAMGWMTGLATYTNPTTNYSGPDNRAYNNATIGEFNATDLTQDHPRHTCLVYKDVYSSMQHYLGKEYADLLSRAFYGYHDFLKGVAACSYFGTRTSDGFNARDWLTDRSEVPIGSMTEFCTRMRYHVTNKTFGTNVDAQYLMEEPALSVDYSSSRSKGRYVVETPHYLIYADNIVLSLPPSGISELAGPIPAAIMAKPQFDFPRPVQVAAVIVKWNQNKRLSNNLTWIQNMTQNIYGSLNHLTESGCLNRVTFFNNPYWMHGNMSALRAAFTDQACVDMWVSLAKVDNPTGVEKIVTGYNLTGAVAREVMRQLRQEFAGEDIHANVTSIPDPDYVFVDTDADGWFYGKTGSVYSADDIFTWARRPLPAENIALAQQAWNIYHSGWSYSAVHLARNSIRTLFPYSSNLTEYNRRITCNGFFVDNNVFENAVGADVPGGFDWGNADLDFQYANTLSNELSPRYITDDTNCQRDTYNSEDVHGTGRYVWGYAPNMTMLKP